MEEGVTVPFIDKCDPAKPKENPPAGSCNADVFRASVERVPVANQRRRVDVVNLARRTSTARSFQDPPEAVWAALDAVAADD